MRQVKTFAELHNFNEITSFAEAERVISSYVVTSATSQLTAQIISDLAAPRQQNQASQLPALQVITGQRGVGKSHLLAFIRSLIGVKVLRSLIADSNILDAIGLFGDKPVTTIDINFSGCEKDSFEKRLRQALCDTLKHAAYFDDDKWAAAVKGEQVFEQALGSMPLGAHMILFIDNLPNRWRIAPEMAESDLDWLALIARQASSLPLRALIVRDEEPETFKTSDPGVYNLSPSNLHEVIQKRVLKKTPQQLRELEEVYSTLLQKLPTFDWPKSEFVAAYPIHPVIYQFAPLFRGAGQSFSLPSFSAAAASRIMSRPELSLVTPDEVFDRYEYEFRKTSDLAPVFKLYDQVVSTAISKMPVSDRLWAKLVLKTLFSFSLAGQTATATQIANAQLLFIDGQPETGYERVAKILDKFVQACPEAFFTKGSGNLCSYVLSSVNQTLSSNLEAQIIKESREISPSDPRLHELLMATGLKGFSDLAAELNANAFPGSLPASVNHAFNWRGSDFHAQVCLTGAGSFEDNWRLLIAPLSFGEEDDSELTMQLDSYTALWKPGKIVGASALAPLRKLLVLQDIAAARMAEGAALSEDFIPTSEKLSEEVRQLFAEFYLINGTFTDGEKILPATPVDLSSTSVQGETGTFASLLSYALDAVLSKHLTAHPHFPAQLLDEDAQHIIMEFFTDAESANTNPLLMDSVKKFAAPLGLAVANETVDQNSIYKLDIFSETSQQFPYVQAVLGFIDQHTDETGLANVPVHLVQQVLSNPPFGLSTSAQNLVLGALTATNLIEFFNEQTGQTLVQKDLLLGFALEKFNAVRRTSSVSYPVAVLAEWARTLTGHDDLPVPQTMDSERRVREALTEWMDSWRAQNLIARFEQLPIELLTVTAWRALIRSKQRFTRVSAMAEAAAEGRVDVATALSRIADVFGFDRNALVRNQEEMRALCGFLDWMPSFTMLRNYLLAAEPTADENIEKLRSQLSEQIQESHTLLDAEMRRGLEVKFDEYRKRYSEFYAASHESNVGPSANRELITSFCASAEWTQFRLLMELRIEGGAFERDAHALLKLAQETRCDIPVMELLQHQPHCCCSFRLHRRVHLGSLLDALKSIASAACTFYSLAIWRHRSELRTRSKEIGNEILQVELEDFLAACGSGDLTELTPDLVTFINDCLAEPAVATATSKL